MLVVPLTSQYCAHSFVDVQALVQLQLDTNCCVRFVDSDEDAAKFVFYFIKSVAETPFKYV